MQHQKYSGDFEHSNLVINLKIFHNKIKGYFYR